MFNQFEEGNLWYENRNNTENGNESDYDLSLITIISEEEVDEMSLDNDSDVEPMSTDMLENIRDGSQSRPIMNRT